MIIDANAYLGPWFVRQIRDSTPETLLSLMDRHGIDKAVVGSPAAVMYRNCQMGNEELVRIIESHRERLLPFAVINPSYVRWEKDLDWCIREMGIRGVRIHPQYHGYSLSDADRPAPGGGPRKSIDKGNPERYDLTM